VAHAGTDRDRASRQRQRKAGPRPSIRSTAEYARLNMLFSELFMFPAIRIFWDAAAMCPVPSTARGREHRLVRALATTDAATSRLPAAYHPVACTDSAGPSGLETGRRRLACRNRLNGYLPLTPRFARRLMAIPWFLRLVSVATAKKRCRHAFSQLVRPWVFRR
jgi:hypothetical protein